MSIKVLYVLLVIGLGLLLGAAIAIYWRVRRHMRASSSQGLPETQHEQKVGKE